MALQTSLRDEAKDDHLQLWILVWSELIAFGILILGFLVVSTFGPEAFALARLHLRPGIAGANTLILLMSGYFVAVAMRRSTPSSSCISSSPAFISCMSSSGR